MSNQIVEIYNSVQEIAWQFGGRGINGECCEDLSFIEFMALKRILELDEISVQEVGNQLNITKSGATKIINRLEQKGYVTKKTSAADGRVCCLHATDNGAKIMNRIINKNILLLEKILNQLDSITIAEIEAALKTFNNSIHKETVALTISEEKMIKSDKCCCCATPTEETTADFGEYVCYCNKVTEEDIKNAILTKGATTVDEVISLTGAMVNSNCEVNNPKGTSCYPDIVIVFNKYI